MSAKLTNSFCFAFSSYFGAGVAAVNADYITLLLVRPISGLYVQFAQFIATASGVAFVNSKLLTLTHQGLGFCTRFLFGDIYNVVFTVGFKLSSFCRQVRHEQGRWLDCCIPCKC